MKYLLVSIFFAAFFSRCLSQNKFIVDVIDFTSSNFNTSEFRCYGVVISPRHVLAPANCVTLRPSRSIGILASKWLGLEKNESYTSADKISIHPDYVTGQNFKSNIAVIRTSSNLDPNGQFKSLSIGKLESNSTYNLFGWGGKVEIPRRDTLKVFKSQFCDSTYPQAFCSTIEVNMTTCTASLGAPLVSLQLNTTAIEGFLINQGNCSINGTKFVLNYHSVGDFSEWIKEVTGAATVSKISFLLILSAISMNFV